MYCSRSFWFDQCYNYKPNPPLASDQKVDICIIGGGYAGLSTAYHLRKMDPGIRVAVLESEIIGYGASGRNAGVLVPLYGYSDRKKLLSMYGVDRLRDAHRYVAEGVDLVQDLITKHTLACDFRKTGFMHLATGKEWMPELEDYIGFYEKIGRSSRVSILGPEVIEKEFNSPYFYAAIYDEQAGVLNPLKLVREYKRIAEEAGAQIYENTHAILMERSPKDILVRTPRGNLRTDRLVLATNAYTHLLQGLEDLKTRRLQYPVFTYANITDPLGEKRWKDLRWPKRNSLQTISTMFYFITPTVDGRLIYGCEYYLGVPKGDAMHSDYHPYYKEDIAPHIETFFPCLKGVRTFQHWGGPISVTRDFIPYLGFLSDPRIAYSCGGYGHGIALMTQNGLTISELLLGRQSERTEIWFLKRKNMRWPPLPLTSWIIRALIKQDQKTIRKKNKKKNMPFQFKR